MSSLSLPLSEALWAVCSPLHTSPPLSLSLSPQMSQMDPIAAINVHKLCTYSQEKFSPLSHLQSLQRWEAGEVFLRLRWQPSYNEERLNTEDQGHLSHYEGQ